jgi:cbb3-type cytochrome oxidase maturation protein
MSVIYILIPIAILLTAIGIYIFFWAVKTEQFDDLEKQGMSILFDDSNDKTKEHKENNSEDNALTSQQEKQK